MKKVITTISIAILSVGLIAYTAYPAHAATFALVQAVGISETSGTGSYSTSNFPSGVTSGNAIICSISSDDNVPSEITAVSDTTGNTFTRDFTSDSSASEVEVWSAPITHAGTDKITVTNNTANSNNSAVLCQEWSFGGSGTLTKDQTKAGTGTATAMTSGASSATTHANELVVGGFVWTGTVAATFTVGAGFSNATSSLVANANVALESQEVSVTGAQTAVGTISASRVYAAALVTYFVNGGGPVVTTAPSATVILQKATIVLTNGTMLII